MASLIPDYEYDIFISYRQKDNRSDKWVTNFVNALKEELNATFKEEISIYFDSNPHDGLLETHDVDGSLKEKIKCLVFIPIVSQTYCDPKSFAWQKEFIAFIDFAKEDEFGLDIKLFNSNVAKRILPVRIHEIDEVDKKLFEDVVGGVLRPVDFIFKSAGVNRPLQSNEDHPQDNITKTYYRDQINKVANAIKEIITSMKAGNGPGSSSMGPKITPNAAPYNSFRNKVLIGIAVVLILIVGFFSYKKYTAHSIVAAQASIAVIPFLNNTGDSNIEWYGLGIANEIRTQLSVSKQFDFISSMQATMEFKNSIENPKTIGDKLGVTHILSGVYQQINNEIKVIVELVDSSTGKIIWSIPYNTSLTDVGNLQASIAKEVIQKFKGSTKNVKSAIINMKAFSEVSIGNELMFKSSEYLGAADHFKKAIKVDSAFFPAWAGLVKALSNYYFDTNDSLVKKEVQTYLRYVDAHFEDSWEKNEVQANYKYHVERKYEDAKELFLKVLVENPDAEVSNYLLANIYKRQLKLSRAIMYMQKAIKLRNTPSQMADLGVIYEANGEYDKADAAYQSALSNGFSLAAFIIYDLHYSKNTLNSLPSEVRQKVGNKYYSDSLLLKRDYRGASNFLRRTVPDSLFSEDNITLNKLACYYLLKEDDSVLYYVNKWNSQKKGALLFKNVILKEKSGLEELLKTFPMSNEDLLIKIRIEILKIQLAVFSRDYQKTTQLLKGLNRDLPELGNYLFLNEPWYDRIKEEYPPFNEVIKNLKLPPKLPDLEIVKM